MIQSMTGFGRAEISENGIDLSVELRSVNHRFLDTALRFPRSLAELEARVREQIGRELTRGRVTGAIQCLLDPFHGVSYLLSAAATSRISATADKLPDPGV